MYTVVIVVEISFDFFFMDNNFMNQQIILVQK